MDKFSRVYLANIKKKHCIKFQPAIVTVVLPYLGKNISP